jgi:hypothetical protein
MCFEGININYVSSKSIISDLKRDDPKLETLLERARSDDGDALFAGSLVLLGGCDLAPIDEVEATEWIPQVKFAAGRYPECVTWVRSMIEKSPGHTGGHFFLTAALALAGDLTAAVEARDKLLRLRPEFSLAWMTENMPPAGQMAERIREGLRKVGVPEK